LAAAVENQMVLRMEGRPLQTRHLHAPLACSGQVFRNARQRMRPSEIPTWAPDLTGNSRAFDVVMRLQYSGRVRSLPPITSVAPSRARSGKLSAVSNTPSTMRPLPSNSQYDL